MISLTSRRSVKKMTHKTNLTILSDPFLPRGFCPDCPCTPGGSISSPGDPSRAICPCGDCCWALHSPGATSWCLCSWTGSYWICWTCLDWGVYQQSWAGGSLQTVRRRIGSCAESRNRLASKAESRIWIGLSYYCSVGLSHSHFKYCTFNKNYQFLANILVLSKWSQY